MSLRCIPSIEVDKVVLKVLCMLHLLYTSGGYLLKTCSNLFVVDSGSLYFLSNGGKFIADFCTGNTQTYTP